MVPRKKNPDLLRSTWSDPLKMLETDSTRKRFINMAYQKGLVQYNKLDLWIFC